MATVSMMTTYPDIARSFIVIASAYKTSSQIMAFYEVGRNAILADPYYQEGNYYEKDLQPERGLGIARMVAHITYLSTTGMENKFGRMIQENVINEKLAYSRFGPMFAIESYLRHQSKKFIARFDANSYLYLTKAMDMYDLTEGGKKTLASEFSNVNKKVLIISFTSDWHFTPADSWEMAKELARLGKNVSYINIESSYGHDSFLLPNKMQEGVVKSFLRNLGDKA
jgi:homoserine O-acetyltransferase